MIKFLVSFFVILGIDQYIKFLFLNGFEWHSKCLSFTLAINKGVAFSMLSFLGENLKFIQLGLILFIIYFLFKEKVISKHPIISGILLGASVSNLLDRFIRGGVVDYVYYHCLFDFAIFNFADVCIDFSLIMFFYFYFIKDKLEKRLFDKNS